MANLSPRGIFLSYRREDAAPYVRLLQFQLRERIPDARVFVDMDSIEPGLDFAEVIREAIDSSAVLVTLIGRQWATLADEEGNRRLDSPDDYVRIEIQTALEHGVRVIPVLVDGARPLRQQQLPAELRKLARLNALELSYSRYEYDSDRLLDLLQRLLAAAAPARRHPSPAANAAARTDPYDVQAEGNALLTDAERAAQSLTDEGLKASALASIAGTLVPTDPDRAARLIADAERAAQSLTDGMPKAVVLGGIAETLAATDPDRAERIARSITDEGLKTIVLIQVAGALAVIDPDRAERIAQSVTDGGSVALALATIAGALVPTDPDRAARLIADAEHSAQSVTDDILKALALARIAGVLAPTDPRRAARLIADAEHSAQSGTEDFLKTLALARIAGVLAPTDPRRAARLIADAEHSAQSVTDDFPKTLVLAGIAEALAAIDPDRAERIAQSLADDYWKASTLASIARRTGSHRPGLLRFILVT